MKFKNQYPTEFDPNGKYTESFLDKHDVTSSERERFFNMKRFYLNGEESEFYTIKDEDSKEMERFLFSFRHTFDLPESEPYDDSLDLLNIDTMLKKATSSDQTFLDKLNELKKMLDSDFITQQDYDAKKSELLEKM